MSVRAGSSRLTVDANVRIVADGHEATLTGSGHELRLESRSPAALWAGLNQAALPTGFAGLNGPRAVGRLAEQLAAVGLALTVSGPAGDLVRIGAGTASSLGRLTVGSRAVRFGSARSIAPVVGSLVRQFGANMVARIRR
jgi:hypothetical protein